MTIGKPSRSAKVEFTKFERDVLLLYVAGKDYSQIKKELGLKEMGSLSRIDNALCRVKKRLRDAKF
jgi:hypothetical protein